MHSLYIQLYCGNNCMLFLLTIIVEDRQLRALEYCRTISCQPVMPGVLLFSGGLLAL